MSGFSIAPFRGMLPRIAPRLLGDAAAVDATNVILSSGEIQPLKRSLLVNTPSISGPWLSVFRAEDGVSQQWLAWTKDIDVVKAPLPPTIDARYVWTGDGEPRHARYSDLPGNPFALGIPRPKTAPTVSPSGGSGATVTRVYVYTFYSQFNEESAESPASALTTGKVDDTWAISGMDAFPANNGTGTASHSAGVTTFTNTGNHWLRVGDEVVLDGETVAVSEVTSASVFKVPGNYAAETTWARKAPWNTTNMKRRLYRSAGSSGSYQLVSDDVSTTYNDTILDAALPGDELISSDWEPPPTSLKGVRELPNGCLVGFIGTQLCYSEPYQPHAWPDRLRRISNHEIVGIEAYGTTVVVGTKSIPYQAIGNEPESVSMDSVQKVLPCLSKRGMVALDDGVLFPTTYGLAYIGLRGSFIWSEPFYARTEWRELLPETMVSASTEGRVYVRFGSLDTQYGVLVFNLAEGNEGLTRLSDFPDELYADPLNGQLYLVDSEGIKQFDAGIGARVDYSWRSKVFHFSKPWNVGAVKVDFESEMSDEDYAAAQEAFEEAVTANNAIVSGYAGLGGLNGTRLNRLTLNGSNIRNIAPLDLAGVTFTLYSDGQPVFSTQLIADQRAFKPPSGYKGENFAVGLTGTLRVKAVKVAETMRKLREL